MKAVLVAAALLLACRPALEDRPWLVTRPQILAARADPPEAPPGSPVTVTLVALDPSGAPDTDAAAWTLCRAPKPLGENRVAAEPCLAPAAADAIGSPVALTIPADACALFGPEPPQPAPGAPPTRPRDPDASGGYYQPFTIALAGALAVGLERVRCGLPDASLAVARAFQDAYHANTNPTLAALAFSIDGADIDPGAIPAGARVTVRASWPDGSAEAFPVLDRGSGALADAREVLTASWYVTGGELDRAADAIADPAVLSAATTWTAPAGPATLEIVVVLRDSRGGSDAARATLVVGGGR